MKQIDFILSNIVDFIWGPPLLILLLGSGAFFLIYSRFLPFRFFTHAINVLTGKYDNKDDPGDINHFQALSGALAATIGMGNISGVSLAVAAGGPGAIFWMWVSAFLGMATKYFTCTLSVLYRGKDANGNLQGGPMYVIREGMGKKWMPLAIFFCVSCFIGATPAFQANQISAVFKNVILFPFGIQESFLLNLIIGLSLAFIVGLVILGGIHRIGVVASRLVPAMVFLFILSVVGIMLLNLHLVIPSFMQIINDAFTAKATLGGAVGLIVIEGAKRAAFSNEAGIGTAPMMHGAAKTKEPVREGLVAMLGPFIDTLLICTMTGICLIITGAWQSDITGNFGADTKGVLMTKVAFDIVYPNFGSYLLIICVMIFAITTIFGLAYYGKKCFSFLFGTKYLRYFDYYYLILVVLGTLVTLNIVVNLIFIGYGLMAIPTIISTIILAPKVMKESKKYFKKL